MAIAEVIVDIVHSDIDHLFDYIIPSTINNIDIGVEVLVPFQRRLLTALVVNIKESSSIASTRLKKIKKVLHNGEVLLNIDLIELAKKMADYYMVPLAMAFDCLIPGGIRGLSRQVSVRTTRIIRLVDHAESDTLKGQKQRALLEVLKEYGELEISEAKKLAEVKSNSTINSLLEKGIVAIDEREAFRSPLINNYNSFNHANELMLTPEQQQAVTAIEDGITSNNFSSFLLHGVTGSGKTEVYLRAIECCLEYGKQGIMLVPEITLTPQTIERLVKKFGFKIAVLHSSLSLGERYDEWRRIASGQVNVVVGARSAVFAPLKKIGVIIIDEEHEATYKQQDGLRYDARQIALWRVQKHQGIIISGSATPAVNSYYATQAGRVKLLELPYRITQHDLPEVQIVDMRQEHKRGNNSVLSAALRAQLLECILQKGEKAIIMLNRRGFSSFLLCKECGYVARCANCDVALTYHAYEKALKCHYCDTKMKVLSHCPACHSGDIKLMGIGTQQVEAYLKQLLPEIDIIRMDSDTTTRKNAHHYLLERFKNAKRAILIGTQMIAKGLDIKEITLVGVINADITLNIPDYRAEERTFQLLTQVAGRSGRGEKAGKVIIQTYAPNSYSIEKAYTHDYHGFYQQELCYRHKLGYPPYKLLVRIICAHEIERIAQRGISFIDRELRNFGMDYTILGPAQAPIAKINGLYRWHLVIKYDESTTVSDNIKYVVADLRKRSAKIEKPLRIIIDIDPESMI